MAKRRRDEGEALHRGQPVHEPALAGEAVRRLCHVKDVGPVVVRVVEHPVANADDKALQLGGCDPNVFGDAALFEDLQDKVCHIVGVETQGVAEERLEQRAAALKLVVVALRPNHRLLVCNLCLEQQLIVGWRHNVIVAVFLVVLGDSVLVIVGSVVTTRGYGGGGDRDGRAGGAAGVAVEARNHRGLPGFAEPVVIHWHRRQLTQLEGGIKLDPLPSGLVLITAARVPAHAVAPPLLGGDLRVLLAAQLIVL
mmetsp:Transcript_29286/g.57304  ORF Transcript_29286/g.57304 Transcript_29286/m.57304 type:complete len:253 (-) Transcript_29286:204-962(-)